MIVADYVLITIATKQACIIIEDKKRGCVPVSVGCLNTPTPKGTHLIDKIYLNPLPIHPHTRMAYNPSYLGNMVITTKTNLEAGVLALHGWHKPNQIGITCSLGCIRFRNSDIKRLINNYYFNKLIIE